MKHILITLVLGSFMFSGVTFNKTVHYGDLDQDNVSVANGMGVEASYVDSLESFADVFSVACGQSGPFLIQFNI